MQGRERAVPQPPAARSKLQQALFGDRWKVVPPPRPLHLCCERPCRLPLGEPGRYPLVGDRGGEERAGRSQPRAEVAARPGFVCRILLCLTNAHRRRDLSAAFIFTLAKNTAAARSPGLGGSGAYRAWGAGGGAGSARAAAGQGRWAACREGRERAGGLRLLCFLGPPPPPCSLAAIRQGPRLLSASGHPAGPPERAAGGEAAGRGPGQEGGGGGRGKRAGSECSPPLPSASPAGRAAPGALASAPPSPARA